MFWLEIRPPNHVFPWDSGTPIQHSVSLNPISAPANWPVEWFKQGAHAWQTDDRQTDRPLYEEMCRNRWNRFCCSLQAWFRLKTNVSHQQLRERRTELRKDDEYDNKTVKPCSRLSTVGGQPHPKNHVTFDLWPMKLTFNKLLEVVEVHVWVAELSHRQKTHKTHVTLTVDLEVVRYMIMQNFIKLSAAADDD